MASVVLVNPSIKNENLYGTSSIDDPSHRLPPLGLLSIASAMKRLGHEVALIDAPFEKVRGESGNERPMNNSDVAKQLVRMKPDYVGVTSTIVSLEAANELAEMLKQELGEKVTIIYGGHQTSAVFSMKERGERLKGGGYYFRQMQEMPKLKRMSIEQRFRGMDFGIVGEGEFSLPELVERIERGEDVRGVPGVVYRKDNGEFGVNPTKMPPKDLDVLGRPGYELLKNPKENYKASPLVLIDSSKPSIDIITSRGCPYACTFCDSSVHGHAFNKHSAKFVVELMEWLEEKWGYRDFYIPDDLRTVDPKFMFELADLLESRGKGNKYYNLSIIGRVSPIFPEALNRFAESGLHQISFGMESVSPEILQFYHKKTNVSQMEHAVEVCHDLGMTAHGFFMSGSPGETTQTLKDTERFIERTRIDYSSNSALTPIPGAELYDMAIRDLKPSTFRGTRYLGNTLGYWLTDPDDWSRMSLWETIWTPRSLVDELGSPEKAKEHIEHYVRRKATK